ncbi:hypothetical protein Q4525_18835 [Shimia thalassica]|uniref:hypothetical protein n=1 Tax=Shimia thalassica TaxID=1715693 RepID=UPI001C087C70|nr:hypothetical protein [Shimia thalassica]MBU2941418.1 hypothetical protein [Shimia thalassica]MDO6486025.1 hypothetical protein [Shimia thalassica]MDO6504998.1 hypothetical protein [Shimia thalassica]
MTPESILAAADAVLLAAPPRGWLDCGLAADLIIRRAGGVPPLGDVARVYETPLQIFRRIRAHGGWCAHFAATVEGNGYRRKAPQTGSVGFVRNDDGRFGHVVTVCAMPGLWIAPVQAGYTVLQKVDESWSQ